MYGMDAATIAPGVTLLSILESRVVGQKPDDAPQYIERRSGQIRRRRAILRRGRDCRNGRIFAVNHRPMPDGGWVAIHQDITAQKRAE